MNLIEFLLKASWRSVLAAAIAGTLGGISSAAAIALINQSISQISPAHPQANFTVRVSAVGTGCYLQTPTAD